jgi:hypothetical protein
LRRSARHRQHESCHHKAASPHGVHAKCIAAILALTHGCKVLLAVPSPGKSLPEHIDHQEILNPIANILESESVNITIPLEARMNAPSYSEAAERSPSEDAASETEIGSVVKHEYGERAAKIGGDSERIISSVALFTSKSIKELEGLTFELQGLQEFLRSETERVQRDIDNALAGLKIIIDTISPWRSARHETSVQDRTSKPEPRIQRTNLAGGQK